jgi:ribonuclease BN (tRNA processing enzyme)
MFHLYTIQAKFGDCLLLKWGTVQAPKYLLIDGGPASVYRDHLLPALEAIVDTGHLEAVILSHVDADHVVGLLDLFAALERLVPNERPFTIGELWHNTFGDTIDVNNTIVPRLRSLLANANVAAALEHTAMEVNGIAQGERLRRLALQLAVPVNSTTSSTITVEASSDVLDLNGLKLTVVGPTEEALTKLRKEWEDWLEENEPALASADPSVLANLDKSGPNLSSICLVAEAHGKRVLLTGDARSDFLLDGLKAQGMLDAAGCVHFDLMKVPHHGSDRNVTRAFFRNVTADKYVISADGKHGNPDLPTMVWIVEEANEQGRAIELLLTNHTDSSRALERSHPPEDFGYSTRMLPIEENWLLETLA